MRFRRSLRRALALIALTPVVPAPLHTQERNRHVAVVPIEIVRNKTVLLASVGGATRRLILDSGMAYDGVLLFDTAGIDLSGMSLVQGAVGGAGSGPPARVLFDSAGSFSVGALNFRNQRVIMLTARPFSGSPTDGVIGNSLLAHYVVELDYDRSRMAVYDPASFSPEPGWTPLDLHFPDSYAPWLKVGLVTAAEPAVTLDTYIDFASSEALELLERDSMRYTLPALGPQRIVGAGLSGAMRGRDGRVAKVMLGPYVLRDVTVIALPADVRSKQRSAVDAVVGNALLRRFNIIFDYAHHRLYLKPNRSFAEPFPGPRAPG